MLWEGEECRAKLKFEVEQSRWLWDVLDMLSFWVFLFKKYYTSIPIGAFLLSLTLFLVSYHACQKVSIINMNIEVSTAWRLQTAKWISLLGQ